MTAAKVYSLDALRDERRQAATFDEAMALRRRGPNAGKAPPQEKTNYLLKASYRTTSVKELLTLSDDEARAFLERIRWGHLGENKQVCPKCTASATWL